MKLNSTHPQYDAHIKSWVKLRDFYKGQDAVKDKGTEYLPYTAGMILDGIGPRQHGANRYKDYLHRAVFPDYVKLAVEHYLGVLHEKPATINLPPRMEPLLERVNLVGEGLQGLLMRINAEQLVTGRVALMADLPKVPKPTDIPYLVIYESELVRNWDDGTNEGGEGELSFLVLDESGPTFNSETFQWEDMTRYRVLRFENGQYKHGLFEAKGINGEPVYNPAEMVNSSLMGREPLRMPAVIINTKNVTAKPDEAPLKSLANLCGSIYVSEADYRENLAMQGQDTLVVIGERVVNKDPNVLTSGDNSTTEIRVGAGSYINVETGGDAKYVGVSANGLGEQRQALENDHKRADAQSGSILNTQSYTDRAESGEALKTRQGSQRATLKQLAVSGAAGLEYALRCIAEWMGEDPKAVKVTPHLEFRNVKFDGATLTQIMGARALGAPVSLQSVHALTSEQGWTKLDYESELALANEEREKEHEIALRNMESMNPEEPSGEE